MDTSSESPQAAMSSLARRAASTASVELALNQFAVCWRPGVEQQYVHWWLQALARAFFLRTSSEPQEKHARCKDDGAHAASTTRLLHLEALGVIVVPRLRMRN